MLTCRTACAATVVMILATVSATTANGNPPAQDTESRRVAIAANKSFVMVWRNSTTHAIQSQRLSSNGAKIGGEFTVSTGPGNAFHADAAFLANGDVVYCWREQEAANETVRTMIRRYNFNFSPLTGAVEVNPDLAPTTQYAPRIAPLTGGGFVIVYYGLHDGSDMSVAKAQVYDAAGTPVVASFQVNEYTENMLGRPYVAALPDGSFIVAWDSNGQQGGNLYGCYVRHYSATGATIGSLITVTTITNSYQQRPKVATFSDNSFAVARYVTREPTSGDHDIAIHHFDRAHNKITLEILVNTHMTINEWEEAIISSRNDGEFGVVYISRGGTLYFVTEQGFTVDVEPAPAPPVECTSACLQYFCEEGSLIDVKVKGVVTSDVWGSAYFTDDSNVATAAVFAGLVAEVLYACESWSVSAWTESRLRSWQMRWLRRMMNMPCEVVGAGVDKRYRMPSRTALLRAANMEDIVKLVRKSQWRWYGHVLRLTDDSDVKASFHCRMEKAGIPGYAKAHQLREVLAQAARDRGVDPHNRAMWRRETADDPLRRRTPTTTQTKPLCGARTTRGTPCTKTVPCRHHSHGGGSGNAEPPGAAARAAT